MILWFSAFTAARRNSLFCLGFFFYLFIARTLLCVVWPVSKHNGMAVWHFTSFSAPAQQASSQCHSSSDCKLHQTALMLKVRQCKSASNHFCWGWADMRDNGVYFHHDHLKERWRETAPWIWTDIVVLDQLGCEIFQVLREVKSSLIVCLFGFSAFI